MSNERNEHVNAILAVLDERIQVAARARGVPACNGRDDEHECAIGDVHTVAALLAYNLADMIDNPASPPERLLESLQDLELALRAAYGDKPRLS